MPGMETLDLRGGQALAHGHRWDRVKVPGSQHPSDSFPTTLARGKESPAKGVRLERGLPSCQESKMDFPGVLVPSHLLCIP